MQSAQLHGRLFEGDLYVKKYQSDDGFVKLGNATEFKTKAEIEKKELKSTGRGSFGQAIDTVVIPKPMQIDIKFNSFDKYALARALMGVAVDVAGQVATISDTTVVAAQGLIDLGVIDIDAEHFSLKNKTKSNAKIDKAHYQLNAKMGLLELLDTAGADVGDELVFSGKTRGQAGFVIEAGTLTSLPLELKLDGYDMVSQRHGILEIPHAVLSSNGDLDWFSDNFWVAGLSGTIVKDEGKSAMSFREFF